MAPCPPPVNYGNMLLHITVIHVLSINFSISKSQNFSKLSQQCTNKNQLSDIAKGGIAFSSVIIVVLTKNAADKTELRYYPQN